MLMSGLGLSVFGMIRTRSYDLYPATLVIRAYFIVCIAVFYAMTGDPLFLVLAGIVGLGLVLTRLSPRSKEFTLRPAHDGTDSGKNVGAGAPVKTAYCQDSTITCAVRLVRAAWRGQGTQACLRLWHTCCPQCPSWVKLRKLRNEHMFSAMRTAGKRAVTALTFSATSGPFRSDVGLQWLEAIIQSTLRFFAVPTAYSCSLRRCTGSGHARSRTSPT